MIRVLVSSLLLAGVGCTTSAPAAKSATPVVLAVNMSDGHAPTAAQLASIVRLLAPEIAARNLTLVQNREAAAYVLAVRFTPDPLTPDGGHVTLLGLRPNDDRRGPTMSERMKAEADEVERRMSVP